VSAARRDPPNGVSPTVVAAAIALAVALLAPSLSRGSGPAPDAGREAAAACAR
jgi:hypothetical protein